MADRSDSVDELSCRRPLALGVLYAHGIDASCRTSTLAALCTRKGIDIDEVLAAIDAAEHALVAPLHNLGVDALIDHLLHSYHRPLAAELVELEHAASDLAGTADSGWRELLARIRELRSDMEQHMRKEEAVLFPWLRARATTASAPIRAMQLEHADTVALLHAIRRSVDRCDPADAAASNVLRQIAHVERVLCEHMHLENNELFIRALERGSSP